MTFTQNVGNVVQMTPKTIELTDGRVVPIPTLTNRAVLTLARLLATDGTALYETIKTNFSKPVLDTGTGQVKMEPILDNVGTPVLDEQGNPTYKPVLDGLGQPVIDNGTGEQLIEPGTGEPVTYIDWTSDVTSLVTTVMAALPDEKVAEILGLLINTPDVDVMELSVFDTVILVSEFLSGTDLKKAQAAVEKVAKVFSKKSQVGEQNTATLG